jgi:hypothetical protein
VDDIAANLTQFEKFNLVRWCDLAEERERLEAYKRRVELQSIRLFGAGHGGSISRDRVYIHMNGLMARLPDLNQIEDESDPMLADVIWWKGDHYAVVEVSLRVDRLDVLRAARRAETLRQSGVDALGVVIGEDWIADDTEILARENDVAWKVGADVSPALITFRQRTAADPGSQQP